MMQLGDVVGEIAKRYEAASLMRLITDNAIRVTARNTWMKCAAICGIRCAAMLKSPGFALVGIVSMGLGMALTTVCVQLGI